MLEYLSCWNPTLFHCETENTYTGTLKNLDRTHGAKAFKKKKKARKQAQKQRKMNRRKI